MPHSFFPEESNQTTIGPRTGTFLDRQDSSDDYRGYEMFAAQTQGSGYDFSLWLQEKMNSTGQTCQDLSVQLGIGKAAVSKWRNQYCIPNRNNLIRLLLYFHLPLKEAQHTLTRLGHYGALYAKATGDAIAMELFFYGQNNQVTGAWLLAQYDHLLKESRNWVEGPDRAIPCEDPVASRPTEVLLHANLLCATPKNLEQHLQKYVASLGYDRQARRSKMVHYLNRWTDNGTDCRALFGPVAQWDEQRMYNLLTNLSLRRTDPDRNEIILLGIKLGMPKDNLEELLHEGGFAPLGLANVDGERECCGAAGGLEGALKLTLECLVSTIPSLFAATAAAEEMIRPLMPGFDLACKREQRFESLLAREGLLGKVITEESLSNDDWRSINGEPLALTAQDPRFRQQAAVYLCLTGDGNRDGIKTFVRHIIESMHLPYEEKPCWLTAPENTTEE